MDLDKAIDTRRSVRRFSTKKVDWKKIIDAIGAANKAPQAGNIYSLRYILIDDKDKISQLAEAAQQDFFENVNYLVVVCSDKTSIIRSYEERGEVYSRQQAGAAIENFLLKIVELGLSTCWVGAFVDEEVKRILEIPQKDYDSINVEAILPVAYEMPGAKLARRKPDLDMCLWFNKWKNKYMKPLKKPEAG